MEVATLTATLVAEVEKFERAMKQADDDLEDVRQQIAETELAAMQLGKALNEMVGDPTDIEATIAALKRFDTAAVGAGAAAKTDAAAINDMGNAAVKSAAKVTTLNAALAEMKAGRFVPTQFRDLNKFDVGRGAIPYQYPDRSAAARIAMQAQMVERDAQGRIKGYYQRALPPGDPYVLAAMEARAAEAAKKFAEATSLLAAAERGQPHTYKTFIGGDPLDPANWREHVWPASRMTVEGLRGGMAMPASYERLGMSTSDAQAYVAAWLAQQGGGRPDSGGFWQALTMAGMMRSGRDLLAAAGWGGGRGIWGPRFGWGRGRGFGRWFPGMAAFGSMAGLAGFGAERFAASAIGIGGSLFGAGLGGGLLGLGALGTFAVGAGTNLAGIGQAAGDIHTVSSDLGALNTAIQTYGANSTQAFQAQQQLNSDLHGFSPAARGAVLAASQTSQAFKAMFDKVTGQAEKTGAEIINQAMQVGQKFLPTIGKFAAQNMRILQSNLQPFFAWLDKGGNAQTVIGNINALNRAVREHGATSSQAAQANMRLNQASQGVGGLGYFTDLEKVFQSNFPTAIHAGEQAFELLIKTVDISAQHVGNFMSKINEFVTRMNNQDFGKWAVGVQHLISLFHTWFGMFISLGKVIFDVFKPAVGLGKGFAEMLTAVFNQIDKYLKQPGTQDVLHNLFSAHLYQLIKGIGAALMQILPIVEGFVSAFLQMEAVISKVFGDILNVISKVIKAFNSIPGADKLLGWVIAFNLIFKANALLLAGPIASLLTKIPLIGSLFAGMATAASGGILRLGGYIGGLIKQMLTLGIVTEDETLSVAALQTEATAGLTAGGGVSLLSKAGLAGLMGRLGIGALAAFAGYEIGGFARRHVGGRGGSILGTALTGAGIGAGIGIIGGPFAGLTVPAGAAIGAGAGALIGGILALTRNGPNATQQLQRLAAAAKNYGDKARAAASSGNRLVSVVDRQAQVKVEEQMGNVIQKVSNETKQAAATQNSMADGIAKAAKAAGLSTQAYIDSNRALVMWQNNTRNSGSALQQWIQKMQGIAQSVEATNMPLSQAINKLIQLAQAIHRIPNHKTIDITLRYNGFRVGPNGDLFPTRNFGPGVAGAARRPRLDMTLPGQIQMHLAEASAGHYSQAKADRQAYMFYQRQLDRGGLTSAQRTKLYQAQAQYYNSAYGTPHHVPRATNPNLPTGFLARQRAELAQARIDITNGQYQAAVRILSAEKKQLDSMLKTAKTQQERADILSQISSVDSAMQQAQVALKGYAKGGSSYAIPLALQLAIAKADALAALDPNLQGPTNQQVKLAEEAKRAAMRAIKSHDLTMQQMIDAWNVVAQMNQIISQRLLNKLAMYHAESTDAITDQVKGLTAAQELQLRELMAQRAAHRGYQPNQGYQSGQGPASPHHRRHRERGGGGGTGGGGGGGSRTLSASSGGTTIRIDKVEIHGVQNVRELASEIERLARHKYQRTGGRR